MNKRGLSGIVTTVIIILLVLAAIAILWLALRNSLQTSADSIGTERFTVNVDIVDDTISYSGCNVSLDVQRPAGVGEIAYLRFVLTSSTGETQVINYPSDGFEPDEFQELETLSVSFSCNLSDLETIEVYPVFANNNIGDNSDEADFPDIPQCSDGFDNDGDGSRDFEPVSNGQGGFYPVDNGCYSAEDDDETAPFLINLNSPIDGNDYQVFINDPNLLLEFSINPVSGGPSTLSVSDVSKMWYNLTGADETGETISISSLSQPDGSPGLILSEEDGVLIEQEGTYEITASVQHQNGDIAISQPKSFSVTFSNIVINSPQDNDFYALIDSINLGFTIQGFVPSNCWYTLNGGVTQFPVSCSQGDNSDTLSLSEGSYNLDLFSEDSGGNIVNADVDFFADTCPSDVNGNGAINGVDISLVISNWGVCDDPDNCPADINGDGVVDGFDLDLVNQFHTGFSQDNDCTNPQNPFPQ